MKQKEKSAAEIVAEKIRNTPICKEYKPVANLPIPLINGVLIKKEDKVNLIKTQGGLIIPGGQRAENSQENQEGILYAVGPKCSEFLRLGLRYQFSSFVDTFFWHEGVQYYKLDETLVYFVVPDPNTVVHNGVKSAKEMTRNRLSKKANVMNKAVAQRDANEKDKYKESIKKKTKTFIIGKK